MTQRITSIRDIVEMWPSQAAMKVDVERYSEGRKANIAGWIYLGRIPTKFFDAVILAAETRGFLGVTYALLTELRKAETNG